MSEYCVVGGSSGLGLVISKQLLALGHRVVVLSRSITSELQDLGVEHVSLDLSKDISADAFRAVVQRLGILSGFCFCQRYRPLPSAEFKADDFIGEYRVNVQSTYNLINAYMAFKPISSQIRVIVIGSTYASSIGFDQHPSYHCAKAALRSLVSYLACNFNQDLIINMLSPPSYIKDGSYDYWKSTFRHAHWVVNVGRPMPTVNDISGFVIEQLLSSNKLISGSHIKLDSGMSSLYFDQVKF